MDLQADPQQVPFKRPSVLTTRAISRHNTGSVLLAGITGIAHWCSLHGPVTKTSWNVAKPARRVLMDDGESSFQSFRILTQLPES